jgi:hypothetical protein
MNREEVCPQNGRFVSAGQAALSPSALAGWIGKGLLDHGSDGRSIDFDQRVGLENLLDYR